ncbi:MAG: hypothetical protein R3C14_44185 [Caldilineaceae bacterium]
MTTSFATPVTNADGTRTAIIAAPLQTLTASALLTVQLPAGLGATGVSGRYFLVRCGVQNEAERWIHWQIYLRRPLFAAQMQPLLTPESAPDATDAIPGVASDLWILQLPAYADPGYDWLTRQPVGQALNLLGPFGQGFMLAPHHRNLLLLADVARAPLFLALIETMLDRGGRVTLIVEGATAAAQALTPLLPIPVEVRHVTTPAQRQEQLDATLQWADQLCVILPNVALPEVAMQVRRRRFHLEAGFAQVLVEADLLCGVGACLACIVPTSDGGYTRACVHGPVLDLVQVA